MKRPIVNILKDRRLNLRKVKSNPIKNKVNKAPIKTPTRPFAIKVPSGRDNIKVVMKKIEIIAKNIRINVK